ncbi:MAG: DUF1846 family protein, partial [Candidatus Omnitrophica bacterium]|nr:DUF1846 family protein [Candidatus Omnitrophota bacterium]
MGKKIQDIQDRDQSAPSNIPGIEIGFDNDKYLKEQSHAILERVKKFDNKLYLEFG